MIGQAAAECGLAGWRLPETGRDHVPHDALVDLCGVDPGSGDRLSDDSRTQIGRRQGLERAQELAGWHPRRADDDCFSHHGLLAITRAYP